MIAIDEKISVIAYIESMTLIIPKKEVEYIQTLPIYILIYNSKANMYELYYNLKFNRESSNDDISCYEFEINLRCKDYNSFLRICRKYKINNLLSE